jgi:flagellar protein FliS
MSEMIASTVQEVTEEEKIRIISLLYEGAINFNRTARKKCEIGDRRGKTFYISKVSAIVRELSQSLNMDAGDISTNLRNLYDFIFDRLAEADTNEDLNAFDDVDKVLCLLRDGWKKMEQITKKSEDGCS